MQLTLHADYGLRALIYLALHPDRLVTTPEISTAYGISTNHLVKVMLDMHEHGFIDCRRGRAGGNRLARPPEEINVGEVVEALEPHFRLVECFDVKTNTCPILAACALKPVLYEAGQAFMDVLKSYTVADVVREPLGEKIQELLLVQA